MKEHFGYIIAATAVSVLLLTFSVWAVPSIITYQGKLTDSSGAALNGEYLIQFGLYAVPDGGNTLWSETQTVTVSEGNFTVQLPLPPSQFEDNERYLEILIRNPDTITYETLTPRMRITSTAYAMRAAQGDYAWDADRVDGYEASDFVQEGETNTIVSAMILDNAVTSAKIKDQSIQPADLAFSLPDGHSLNAAEGTETDVVYVNNKSQVGIGTMTPNAALQVNGSISRQGTALYGNMKDTHVNLGINSTTGSPDNNSVFATVSGGDGNFAKGDYAVISGGGYNETNADSSTVSGGGSNEASGTYSTVSGGGYNRSSADYSTVSGGRANRASGEYSTVSGGEGNRAGGHYSWAGGSYMQLTGEANRTFVWGHSDTAVSIATSDAFIIYSGNVGIGRTEPSAKLDIAGGKWDLSNNEGDLRIGNDDYRLKIGVTTGGAGASTSYIWAQKNPAKVGRPGIMIGAGNKTLIAVREEAVGINTTDLNEDYILNINGTAYATGAAGALSDRRHKTNISDLSCDALGIIHELRPVTFEWKEPQDSGMEGPQLGFIAQEVEEVLPEACTYAGQ